MPGGIQGESAPHVYTVRATCRALEQNLSERSSFRVPENTVLFLCTFFLMVSTVFFLLLSLLLQCDSAIGCRTTWPSTQCSISAISPHRKGAMTLAATSSPSARVSPTQKMNHNRLQTPCMDSTPPYPLMCSQWPLNLVCGFVALPHCTHRVHIMRALCLALLRRLPRTMVGISPTYQNPCPISDIFGSRPMYVPNAKS